MNQDDIFNLLLLILLMSNERDNDTDSDCRSARGSLNELIIASMLMGSCNSRDATSTTRNDPCGRTRNDNTTF